MQNTTDPQHVSPKMQELIETERTICEAQLNSFSHFFNHVLDNCFGKPGGSDD